MKLRDFEYVEAIARTRSFSRAAKELYVSQPALTQAVQRLEEELKLPLFTREHNRVTLTVAGELFLEEGKEILKITSRLRNRITSIANIHDMTIKLGVPHHYGTHTMPIIMSYISSHYPGIHISLTEDVSFNLEKLLDSNQLDFALIPFPILTRNLRYEVLFEEEILLAAHNQRALPRSMSPLTSSLPFLDLSALADEPYILMKQGQKFRQITDRIFQEYEIRPNIYFETLNLATIEAFVRQNLGIGFLPSSIPRDRSVTYYRFASRNASRKYVIAYKEDNYQAKASMEIVGIIKQALEEQNLVAYGRTDSRQLVLPHSPPPGTRSGKAAPFPC